MKNQQLYSRLAPEAVERVIRRFNDRELTMQEAMSALSVSRAQVYNLRTQWLAAGKKASFLGASGGDRKSAWPTACVEELKTLIEASKDDGLNFELYADELARKHDFVRDRSSVRKFCEKNLMALMRSTFPVERKKPDDHYRRWEAESYGEIPDVRAQRLIAEGRNRLRPVPNEKVLRLFLSRHVPRKVELGCRIDFMGRKWRIAKTLKKTVWLAIRPENRGFYVLEERPDPTNPVVPRILLAHRF